MTAFGFAEEERFSMWTFEDAVVHDSFEVIDTLSKMGFDQRLLNRIESSFVMDTAAISPHSRPAADRNVCGPTTTNAMDEGSESGHQLAIVSSVLPEEKTGDPLGSGAGTVKTNANQNSLQVAAHGPVPSASVKSWTTSFSKILDYLSKILVKLQTFSKFLGMLAKY